MFITGPDVIKTVTHEEVTEGGPRRRATHTQQSGVAHFAAERRSRLPSRDVRELLVASCRRTTSKTRRARPPTIRPTARDDALNTIVPDEPNKPYDIKDIIRAVVDDGDFFEVHEHFAQNIVVGFARLGGRPVGIVAQPAGGPRGVLDIDASRQGRALRALLRLRSTSRS